MIRLLAVVAFLIASGASQAQGITTVAGGGVGDGGPATAARIWGPVGLVADGAGNVYIANTYDHRVRRVDATTGVITTVAGNGLAGFGGDGGPATAAYLHYPGDVALDASGNLFIADGLNRRIRRVDATTGTITTVAGNGTVISVDGVPATASGIGDSTLDVAIGLDSTGHLYILSVAGVRRVDAATGIIQKVAGGGSSDEDGIAATTARIQGAAGMAVAPGGDLYILVGYRLRKVTAATGIIATIAGGMNQGYSGDGGLASAASFEQPIAVFRDESGNLFVADGNINTRIRRIDAGTGVIALFAGGGAGGDGSAATAALLRSVISGAVDGGGRIYLAEADMSRVRRIEGGIVATHAGVVSANPPYAPEFTGDGSAATQAHLGEPAYVAFDTGGNLFVSDPAAHRVRRVGTGAGMIGTVAGTGAFGLTPDGAAANAAPIGTPLGLAAEAGGGVLFTENSGSRVRRIAAGSGLLETAASGLYGPHGIALDGPGNVYIVENSTGTVRSVPAGGGTLSTFAGSGGGGGSTGDGGLATQAAIPAPIAIAFDAAGNAFITQGASGNCRIRRVAAADATIATFAGNDTCVSAGDGGPAAQASLAVPAGIATDAAGNVYVSEEAGHRVRRIAAGTGIITTIAGNGLPYPSADNALATAATIVRPRGLAVSGGELYIAESGGARVRKLALSGLSPNVAGAAFEGRLPQTTSLPRRIVITNLGTSAAAIASIATAAPFAVTHDCGTSLAGGASCFADVTFTPASAASFAGTLAIQGPNTLALPLSGAGELSLVTHFYEAILRRLADAPGQAFWTGERDRMLALGANVNETWFAMSSFFIASAEYQAFNRTDTAFVTDLYKTFFDRDPDAPGLAFWLDQVANGMPREVVLAAFQHSPEFKSFTEGHFGNTAARAEVDMVMDFYRGLLGRLPDTNGFSAWVNTLRSAQCANDAAQIQGLAESISEAFATSNEYVSKSRTDAQYVGDLYNAFLRRGGELTGVLAWIDALQQGTMTRAELRDAFRASSEFGARVTAVVNQGCLP